MAKDTITVTHPHDGLVRHVLASEDMVAALLRLYLDPRLVKRLDLKRLKREDASTVDATLAGRFGDVRYSTRFKHGNRRVGVYIIFEHQSTKDALISLRLLRYITSLYENMARSKGFVAGAGAFPYPIAIILHHGPTSWNDLLSMTDLIEKVPGVDQNVLNIPLCVIDLANEATDIERGPPALRALFEALRASGKGKLRERLGYIAELLARGRDDLRMRDWTTALLHYASAQYGLQAVKGFFYDVYATIFGSREGRNMAMSAMEELMLMGEIKGRAEGKAEAVLGVLTARFKMVPRALRKKIEETTDTQSLDELIPLAAICDSLEDFKRRMP